MNADSSDRAGVIVEYVELSGTYYALRPRRTYYSSTTNGVKRHDDG